MLRNHHLKDKAGISVVQNKINTEMTNNISPDTGDSSAPQVYIYCNAVEQPHHAFIKSLSYSWENKNEIRELQVFTKIYFVLLGDKELHCNISPVENIH